MLCHDLGLLAPNKYILDLLNGVLNIHFDLRAVKVSEIKVGGQKKSAGSAGCGHVGVKSGREAVFFIL